MTTVLLATALCLLVGTIGLAVGLVLGALSRDESTKAEDRARRAEWASGRGE